MRNRLYIVLLLLLIAPLRVLAQPMPPVCTGSWERYAAQHSVDYSSFSWIIKNGVTDKIIYGNGDSIDIHWTSNPGLYRIGITEISNFPVEGVNQCYGDTVWTTIEVRGTPVNIGADRELCYGEEYEFDAGDGFISYVWNNDASLNSRYITGTANQTDTIVVLVENNIKCRNTDTAIVLVRPLPNVKITADGRAFRDTMMCGEQTITLDAGSDHVFFDWSTGDITQTIVASALAPSSKDTAMKYMVTAANQYGCQSTDSVYILRCEAPDNKNIPSAFTPNGDQWNQTWKIPMLQFYPNATIDVYDRWGRSVFHSDRGYTKDWDGTAGGIDLPMDNYFYIIRLDKNSKPIVGNVLILR